MNGSDREHWDRVYGNKGEFQVSWFQDDPALSLELIRSAAPSLESAIIDIGGGAARLVDALLAHDYRDVTVLDLSEAAIGISQARLGGRAERVTWIAADVTRWRPGRRYDLWHDRAAFHFLTAAQDRVAYVQRLMEALRPNGHAIIATFALDGPERCSGLPVVRYDAAKLSAALGDAFRLIEARRQDHRTPSGSTQQFLFSVFKRSAET
jgi:SAM-dependent methyltransferase